MISARYDEDVERAAGGAFLSLLGSLQADASVLGEASRLAMLLAGEGTRWLPDAECLVAAFEDEQTPKVRALGVSGAWLETHANAVWPREGTLAALCVETAQPLEISRSEQDSEPREPLNGGPMGTVRMVPLPGDDGTPLGVLALYRAASRPLSNAERTLVDAFAVVVGISLQRAIAHERAALGEARLRLGVDLALDLAATLDPSEVVARLLRRAADATSADRGTLGRIVDDTMVTEESFDRDGLASSIGMVTPIAAQPILTQVMRERRPLRAGRYRGQGLEDRFQDVVSRAAHTLTLPLVFAGDVLAVMVLQRRGSTPFDDADVQTAQVIGNIAGLALRNADLYHSLQQADEARAAFTSMVVHEMRSPLTVITGYLEMMASGMFGDAPPAWSKPLDTVEAKSVELQSLVDDLLFSSRLETGRLATSIQPVDLRGIVQETLERAGPRARLLEAKLHSTLPPEPVVVDTDSTHVERILDNLVNNALNYGGERPEVSVVLEPGDEVRIAVSDRGHGISPEHQEKIFERFFRVQDRTRHPGTGLGLYISRQLSDRLGGSLTVERSAPGAGSTFALRLPGHAAADGAG